MDTKRCTQIGSLWSLPLVLRCGGKSGETPVIHSPTCIGGRESNDAAFSGEHFAVVQELRAALPGLEEF